MPMPWPKCLDEVATTINVQARRLLGDMFEMSTFIDLHKFKVEMKMREFTTADESDLLLLF